MKECCKIFFLEKDKENLSIKTCLSKNLQIKWDIAEETDCEVCFNAIKEFFVEHSETNYYYDYESDYLSDNETGYNDKEVIYKLKKYFHYKKSVIPWLQDNKYIFYNQEDLDFIFRNFFYSKNWEFKIEYKNKKYNASIASDYDHHHRQLSSTDFYDDEGNNLQDIFDKENKEEFCLKIRIKNHSFSDGAGTYYGHCRPDYELTLKEDDFKDNSFKEKFFYFIQNIEKDIIKFLKK